MTWQNLVTDAPPAPGTRFVALHCDMGGAGLYRYGDDGHLHDAGGDDVFDKPVDGVDVSDWLWDAGYLFWAPLPEGCWRRETNNGWRRSVSNPPKPGTRFVVLLNNLKGVMFFVYSENKRLIDGTGDDRFGRGITKIDLADYLFSSRLQCWMPLPEGQRLFFEGVGG